MTRRSSPARKASREITMSISSAPAATASSVSRSLTSSDACPDGKAVATEAAFTPVPASASRATPTSDGYTQTAAQDGTSGIVGAGQTALAHRWRTLPAVSAPSSVVRSTMDTARRMPCCLAVVLIERLPSTAARSSMPTRSTCGSRRITSRVWRARGARERSVSVARARGARERSCQWRGRHNRPAMRRAAVIVLDACGVGALPDADQYEGDAGSNTLGHLAERVGGLELPTLQRLGLGSILPLRGVPPAAEPVLHGRLAPLGPGKESTTGHWELMGVVPSHALPTYPQGFPPDVIDMLERATNHRFCCNLPYSGTEVLDAFGERHLETGVLILYTSADSVLQIAAHVDVLDEPALYAVCEEAREVMNGEHRVGRVIARPFEGSPGAFVRREGRRNYAAPPPGRSYLEELQDAGATVHAVGKIRDLFAGVGIDIKHEATNNTKGIEVTTRLLGELEGGLIFVN